MYFIGLDLGTSGLKAGVIDDTGNIKADLYMDTHFILQARYRVLLLLSGRPGLIPWK